MWGLSREAASPRSCNTLFLQCAALGLGEGEEGKQLPGSSGPNPAQPAHREGVVYVEGNLPPLEGELLLPVPAHCHQSRHRPRRCRCHRHHLLPAAAAAAAAAAPAAAASSQLLPATAKPRERKHPPPRSTFATGERGGGARSKRGRESRAAFPITRFHTRSANQRPAAPGPAPSRRLPSPTSPPRPPAGLQSGSKGEAERTCWPRDIPARLGSPGSRSPSPPRLHSPCPHPASDPYSPVGAPRPGWPLGCSCQAPPRPWEGSTPPRLCRVRGGGKLRPSPHPGRRRALGSDLH